MNNFLLATYSLWKREMVRFFRQRSRVVGALGPPALFWLLIGAGMGKSFQLPGSTPGDGSYLQYFFPGTVMLIVLFTSIFSTISLIEDRQAGFLQSVLVAPLARSALVAGKILGGATLAMLQALAFLLFAPTVGFTVTVSGALVGLAALALSSIGLTAMGFVLAWRLNSVQGFHAIMNLFQMPMWLLSGALFPVASAPIWLRWPMQLNPLTYGVAALHQMLQWHGASYHTGVASAGMCLAALGSFAVAMVAGSLHVVRRV